MTTDTKLKEAVQLATQHAIATERTKLHNVLMKFLKDYKIGSKSPRVTVKAYIFDDRTAENMTISGVSVCVKEVLNAMLEQTLDRNHSIIVTDYMKEKNESI